MKKKPVNLWKKRGMAIALSVAIIAQTTVTGYGAEISMEEVVAEEISDAEEGIENIEEENQLTISENSMAEEVQREKVSLAETKDAVVTSQEKPEEVTTYSEESDFVINANGVLTEYLGNASEVIIPEGVVEIGSRVFEHSSVEKVEFPQGLRIIGDRAFYGCELLKEIELVDSVESIGYRTFGNCTSLEKVSLNEGLLSIGEEAFIASGFGKQNSETGLMEEGGKLIIPATVQTIGRDAFVGAKCLEEVFFADGYNQILTLPEVNNSDNGIFGEIESLKKVRLPERLTVISGKMFHNCINLETITLGGQLKTIEEQAFSGCESLKEVTLSIFTESIGYRAFSDCISLEKVYLNDGLITIGEEAFAGAGFGRQNNVTGQIEEGGTLTIPGTVQEIGKDAFAEAKCLEKVIFENGTNEILTTHWENNSDSGIFGNIESLKTVILPERLTVVNGKMFSYCTNLETITFGSKLKTIGEQAFRECENLKTITLPESVESIGYKAFQDCISLESVELNEGLLRIGEAAFYGANFGKADKNTGKVIEYGNLTIPGTVQEIGKDAFGCARYLREVTFANGKNQTLVVEEGNNAYLGMFGLCENLEKVFLPKRLEKLPYREFFQCSNLKIVYIPETITNIPQEEASETFYDCNKGKLVIYGETGSEAEKFANEMEFNFKNSSSLGIFPTGMILNRKLISVSGENAIGKTFTLNAIIKPVSSQNKSVIFTSKNPEIATVDENGTVTIVGYGETEITVTSMEKDNVSASCRVVVLREWTQEEVMAAKQYIIENNDFTIISNVYKDLQEVEITSPEGVKATWRLPYEIGVGTKKYDIVLEKEGYVNTIIEDVEVNGILVTGVTMDCISQIEQGNTQMAVAEISVLGGSLKESDYHIEWKSSNTANISVEEKAGNPLEAMITGVKKSNKTNISVKVILNKNGEVSSVAKAAKGVTWFETTTKVNVTNYVIVDDIIITAQKDGKAVEISELSGISDLTDKQIFTLTAECFGKDKKAENAALNWKSSNTGVATVKANKDGTATLTVLGKGTTFITATAGKNGGYAESFRVTVKDSTPRLAEKNITINLYKTEAAEYVHILPSDAYGIETETLQMVTNQGEETPFVITCADESNLYKISVKESQLDKIKPGNYAVKILVKTSVEEAAHELELKIKVEKKLPKVTLKQGSVVALENGKWEVNATTEALNLYEKNAYGVIWASSDEAKISEVSYEAKDKDGIPRIVEAEESLQSNIFPKGEGVLVKTADVTGKNYAKTKNKGTITVKFEGYLQEAVYQKDFTVSVNKKLPVIMAVPSTNILYPETVANVARITLVDKATNKKLALNEGYEVDITKQPNGCASYIGHVENCIELTALKKAKGGTAEYEIRGENWLDEVKVFSKFTLKIGKAPTLAFENAKITLNAAYTLDTCDGVDTNAYVTGVENVEWQKIKVTGKDKTSTQVLKDKALSIFLENGKIKAGIIDSSYFTKSGNYAFEISAYADSEVVKGSLKVEVTLPKTKPAVTLKTKGSIQLLDRENSRIIATPTVKNYTGKIVDVDLYGAYADKFEVVAEAGNIVIKAQENETLKTKTNYTLHMYVELESGVRLPATVKIKPTQTNPKLVQNTKQVVLFETAKGTLYGEEFTVNVAEGQKGTIDKICLDADNDTFCYNDTTNTVYVKDTASLKPGKTYTLKFEVTFEEAGMNEKPVTVSLKVDYRK